jgi:hypothetical protein
MPSNRALNSLKKQAIRYFELIPSLPPAYRKPMPGAIDAALELALGINLMYELGHLCQYNLLVILRQLGNVVAVALVKQDVAWD